MLIKISEKIKKKKIIRADQIAQILVRVLNGEDEIDKGKEHFWGVYLNSRSQIIRIELVSLGTLNANLVHPREVYRPAIECSSQSVIVVHNHPSGDTEPSEADLEITKRLEKAGDILGIDLLDHIIITESGNYFSFKEKGLLTK